MGAIAVKELIADIIILVQDVTEGDRKLYLDTKLEINIYDNTKDVNQENEQPKRIGRHDVSEVKRLGSSTSRTKLNYHPAFFSSSFPWS